MKQIVKNIPNFITSLNLVAGFTAIVFAFNINTIAYAPYYIFLAAVFDFFDGFAARMLKSNSLIGKELDSLADVVSFGIAPGVLMYQMLQFSSFNFLMFEKNTFVNIIVASLIPVFSALRLAKFNIDERQSDSFIGLPTPASAILIASITIIFFSADSFLGLGALSYTYIGLIAISVVDSFLMVCNLPMFSLKMKSFSFKKYSVQISFLAICLLCLIFLRIKALPVIIVLYILISVFLYVKERLVGKAA